MSFSIALGLRDRLLDMRLSEGLDAMELRKFFWSSVKSKRMAISLAIVVFLLLAGAFVEVYVSAPIARIA
jgi:uncharacterized membrane protein SpoIIM required for sporulation